MNQKIPVILDTDIGWDIDDTWALAFLLKCPELDVKLISLVGGNPLYQATLTAKLLSVAKREDIPIVFCPSTNRDKGHHEEWIGNFTLENYKGKIEHDIPKMIATTILSSNRPVKIISLAKCTNIALTLEKYPEIITNAEFVGMQGSIYKGYNGSNEISLEANVKYDSKACADVFSSAMKKTVTPLDTCGVVKLTGKHYELIKQSKDPLIQAVLENYRYWFKNCPWDHGVKDLNDESSVLFDIVAVYLAFTEENLVVNELPIIVTDEGYTKVDPSGSMVRLALEWKDLNAFYNFLVNRLR